MSSIMSFFSKTPLAINSLKLNFFTGCIPRVSKILFQCRGLNSTFPKADITGIWLDITFTSFINVYSTLSLLPSGFVNLYCNKMLLDSNCFISLSMSSVFKLWKLSFDQLSFYLLNLSMLFHSNLRSLYLPSNSINSLFIALPTSNNF